MLLLITICRANPKHIGEINVFVCFCMEDEFLDKYSI